MGVVRATMEYYYCGTLAALAVVDGVLHTKLSADIFDVCFH